MRRSEAGLEFELQKWESLEPDYNALQWEFLCGSYFILKVVRSCAKSDDSNHHLLRANHGQWVA